MQQPNKGQKNKSNISRRTRRSIIFGCLLLLIGICAIAVAAQQDEGFQTQTEEEVTEIEFSWWGNDERHVYTMNAVDQFQEEYSNIKVSYRYGVWNGFEKRNRVWMESRNEADVMQINFSWLAEYSPDGTGYYDLYELADYIDLSNFTEAELAYGERNGKLNAIPIAFNTPTMYYNANLFEQYGLELPTTWEDFFTAAKVMREDGIYVLGMAKKQMFLFLISYLEQSTGNSFFDENGRLQATPSDIELMLTMYRRLLDEKVVEPLGQFANSQFTKGELAGIVLWVSDADKYCDALEGNGGTPVIGEYPMLEDAKRSGWYRKPATLYAISAITEHPEQAATLLNFLVNSEEMAEQQKTEKGVPVSRSALATLEKKNLLKGYGYQATQKMESESDMMGIMVSAMENESIIDAFKELSDEYIYGKQSLEKCAQSIWNEINSIVEQVYG